MCIAYCVQILVIAPTDTNIMYVLLLHFVCDCITHLQDYQLIVSGHSLGAGVASVLALLLRKSYPDLHCYALSPPGCVFKYPPFLCSTFTCAYTCVALNPGPLFLCAKNGAGYGNKRRKRVIFFKFPISRRHAIEVKGKHAKESAKNELP